MRFIGRKGLGAQGRRESIRENILCVCVRERGEGEGEGEKRERERSLREGK